MIATITTVKWDPKILLILTSLIDKNVEYF